VHIHCKEPYHLLPSSTWHQKCLQPASATSSPPAPMSRLMICAAELMAEPADFERVQNSSYVFVDELQAFCPCNDELAEGGWLVAGPGLDHGDGWMACTHYERHAFVLIANPPSTYTCHSQEGAPSNQAYKTSKHKAAAPGAAQTLVHSTCAWHNSTGNQSHKTALRQSWLTQQARHQGLSAQPPPSAALCSKN